MNLKELKHMVDQTVERLPSYIKAEDITVLITLSEVSMGARAASGIKYAHKGIDWESGQFRIEPQEDLVKRGNSKANGLPMRRVVYAGRKTYHCPQCEEKGAKSDNFCRGCGQKFAKEDA